ncbi:MAG: exosortase/archaeosortase family protein [Planctomycetota bacterium]
MTSTPASPSLPGQPLALSLIAWPSRVWIACLVALWGLMYHQYFYLSWRFAGDPDWSHTLIVPLISVYYIFQQRQEIMATPRRVSLWGLPLMLFGLLIYAGDLGTTRNDMIRGFAMVVTLFGMIWFLLGGRMMRWLWFPIAFLFFAVRITPFLWTRIAEVLKDVASVIAGEALIVLGSLFGFTVTRTGNLLELNAAHMLEPSKLNVAEACSGLRMLMAFLALGTALAFLMPRTWWQRTIMLLMAVPIAITVNAGRVVVLGLLSLHDPALARGDFHLFVGMLMLIPAAGLFLLLGWALDKAIIRPDEDEPLPPAPIPPADRGPARVDARVMRIGLILTPLLAGTVFGLAWAIQTAMGNNLDDSFSTKLTQLPILTALAVLAITVGLAVSPDKRPTLRGLLIGAFGVLGMGILLLLVVNGLRPFFDWSGGGLAWVLVGLCASGLLAAFIYVARRDLMPNSPRPRQQFAVALGLCAGLLGAGVMAQGIVLSAAGYVLVKQSVPLRDNIKAVSPDAGPWQEVFEEPALPSDIVKELGTQDYFMRHYRDTRVEQPAGYRYAQDGSAQILAPNSHARVHIAYYTGLPDSVPHVPDRCYMAAGLRPAGRETITLRLDPDRATPAEGGGYLIETDSGEPIYVPTLEVPATLFNYNDVNRPELGNRQVIYFFVSNGEFAAGPAGVRRLSYDPTDLYAYYCKVEVQIVMPGEEDATQTTNDFISHFLPEVMRILPDWREVEAGRYPPPAR